METAGDARDESLESVENGASNTTTVVGEELEHDCDPLSLALGAFPLSWSSRRSGVGPLGPLSGSRDYGPCIVKVAEWCGSVMTVRD